MNKLGPHVIESTPPGLAWSHVASIVKGLANLDPLRQAKDDAVRVFRPDAYNLDLNDAAGIAGHVLNGLQGYRHPKLYADPWNERHPTMAQIKAVVDILHANGVQVAGCSWGTGDYTALDWEAAIQGGVDAVSCHCYWDPEKLDIYEAYRYRQFWEAGDPPVIITECGRRHGYHDLEELLGYEVNIAKDPYVLGATVFCNGPWYFPNVDPQAFNVDPLVPQLLLEGGPMPIVGQGFQKCIPIIGNFTEDEAYHARGTPYETSLAVAEQGYATWSAATNETVAHRNDGLVFGDLGNHGDGSGRMIQMRGPFK